MGREGISRRSALAGATTLGLTLPVLAACSGDEPDRATDPAGDADRSDRPDPSEPPSPDAEQSAETSGQDGAPGIVTTAEVPVGGGVVLTKKKVVVTQPTKGAFKCFTAVCTHQGCLVANVSDTINCSCHGSRYSIADGSVVGGPAPSALAELPIVVEGDDLTLA
jgi:Rieske Fe-S protein